MALELQCADAKHAPPTKLGRLPRVLYVVALKPGLKFGSAEEQITMLAKAFQREGGLFLPLFISDPQSASLKDFESRGIPAECLDLRRFHFNGLRTLCRLIRRERIELVHWNFTEPVNNGYLWGLSAACPRVKHWFTDHISQTNSPPPIGAVKAWLKKLLLRRYGRVLCVSRFVEQNLRERGHWSNLITQHHFINTDRFAPDAAVRAKIRSEYDAGDRFVMLFVGQLIREKGVDVAVEAMTDLPDDAVLWIIGSGPLDRQLAARIGELGLNSRVRLLGLHSKVEPFFQAADLFLCPSIWAEAAGLVNLEAQACGLPVIASRVGGIPEYVADERTGLLFEPGDRADLVRSIRCLIEKPEMRAAMSSEARAWALDQFSPDARIPELLDLYRKGT